MANQTYRRLRLWIRRFVSSLVVVIPVLLLFVTEFVPFFKAEIVYTMRDSLSYENLGELVIFMSFSFHDLNDNIS